MAHNNDLDPNLNEHLRQHYAVNPRPGFLPELKNGLLGQFPRQQRTQLRRHKFAFGLIATALVLVIVLFATPLGSALAQEFVELFSRSESNVMPNYPGQTAIARDATMTAAPTITPGAQTTTTPTPTRTPNPTSKEYANLTIEEVEQIAGFDVLAPTYLPRPIEFYGANYDPKSNVVFLFYDGGMLIRQEPVTGTDDCDLCSEVGATARVESVQIGDIEGELIYGVWHLKDENKYWLFTPQIRRVRWQTNNTVFELLYDRCPSQLTNEDLLEMAESFQ